VPRRCAESGADDADGNDDAVGAEVAAAAHLWDPERTLVPALAALCGSSSCWCGRCLARRTLPFLAHRATRARDGGRRVRGVAAAPDAQRRDAARAVPLVLGLRALAGGVRGGIHVAVDGTEAVLYGVTRAVGGGRYPFAEVIGALVVEAGCDPRIRVSWCCSPISRPQGGDGGESGIFGYTYGRRRAVGWEWRLLLSRRRASTRMRAVRGCAPGTSASGQWTRWRKGVAI
jgi:hypothetical protein